jgi:hypothetical protein
MLLALLLAPTGWFLQLTVNAALASQACFPKDVPLGAPRWPGLLPVLAGVEVSALALAVVGGWLAWRNWRRTRAGGPDGARARRESGGGRSCFLALAGLLTSGLFLVAVLVAIAMLAIGPLCGNLPAP